MGDEVKEQAAVRRQLMQMATRLDGVLDTAGWRTEAKPLRAALLKLAVAYPDVQADEFTELVNAIERILPILEPQK